MPYQAGAVHLYFNVLGQQQVSEVLEGTISDLQDWSPAFQKIAVDFRDYMEQVFATEGGATKEGQQWAALSPRYAKWKRQHYPGRKVLTREGWLRQSLATRTGRGTVTQITKDTLVVGSSLKVGNWNLGGLHHEGLPPVPQRRIISINDERVARWVGFIRDQMSWEN